MTTEKQVLPNIKVTSFPTGNAIGYTEQSILRLRAALTATQKHTVPEFTFDDLGSKYFDEFVETPEYYIPNDLAPKFYPVLSSLLRFLIAVVGSVAAGCGAEPFRLRSTASRRWLSV